MTLCRWINDYLFLPLRLGLRRWGDAGMIVSLFVSMLAISLWHGLSSGFVAFGVIQGVLISVSILTLKARDRFFKGRKRLSAMRRIAGPLVTFHLLTFSFIFFRCATFGEGVHFFLRLFQGPFHFHVLGMGLGKAGIAGCVIALLMIEWFECFPLAEGREAFMRRPMAFRWGAYYLIMTGILLFGRFWPKEFIYFKF